MKDAPLILILCTGNSCRSQIAEGILKQALGATYLVASAGSKPVGFVHPFAICVMSEIGIDISHHLSKHVNEFLELKVDTVITVCGNADQACPVFPGPINRHHFPFFDPANASGSEEEQITIFRNIRDEIHKVFGAYASGRLDEKKRQLL